MRKSSLLEGLIPPELLPLLMVGLVLPLASELAITAGQRAGLIGADSADMFHVLVMSTAFTAVVLVQCSSLRQLNASRKEAEERRVREALTQTEARHHLDVTQLKVAEAAANRLLNAVEQLDEVVFMTDRDGTINYVNPAFVRLYGYSREEAIGCTPRILKSGEFTREQNAALWAELLSGRSIRAEYNNRTKSGSLVAIVSTASPIVEPDGTIQGFIAVQSDLREQKRLQEEHGRLEERMTHLARMESLGTLAGGMAHDFNNLLSIILTHASLLRKRSDDHAVVERVVNTIQQAVKRGASLTRQILTFARRADTKLEDVALPKLIMELASMIGETFPRTIEVTLDIDPDLPLLRADSGQIHQALLNLCVNARDAMPDGGNLTIAASWTSAASMKEALLPDASEQKYIIISVTDTGFGIDDQTRARLFEPFFTTKERGKGTGLGLAVVFGVAQNHEGMVDVDSRLGEGTTFRLYLPLVQPSAQPAIDGEAVVAGGTETLLVIEDEPALRDSLSSHLRAHGYHVTTASDGVDALEQLRARTGDLPAAVLMDLGMPRLSASELVRGVREVAPKMQIMAMTGYVDPDIHASVVSAGVRSIVQKPFTIEELLTALRAVLTTDN